MALNKGNAGIVKVGSDTVAEVTAFTLSESIGVVDDTVLGDTSKSHLVTIKEWSASISAFWDETDSTGQEVMVVGASIDLSLLPQGDSAGDISFAGTASITAIERSNDIEGVVTASFTVQGNGDLTRSVLA